MAQTDTQTDTQTDMATLWPTRPSGAELVKMYLDLIRTRFLRVVWDKLWVLKAMMYLGSLGFLLKLSVILLSLKGNQNSICALFSSDPWFAVLSYWTVQLFSGWSCNAMFKLIVFIIFTVSIQCIVHLFMFVFVSLPPLTHTHLFRLFNF